jgi:two-component system cell cycle sensor histidine kinase/response regulator CckA
LVRAHPDCIALADYGSGSILAVNDEFERLTGVPRAELLGRTLSDLALVQSAGGAAWLAALGREPIIKSHELEIHRRDGSTATVAMSIEVIAIDGLQRLLLIGRDVTDPTPAEHASQRTEARYRELIENASDIVFSVGRDGYCLSMNRAGHSLSGYGADPLHPTHLTQLVAPGQAEFLRQQFARVFAGEDVPALEVDTSSKEGARITLEVVVRPIREGDSIVAALAIARDVTARIELEQQLRQAQKMDLVGRLAAGLAHDFNNLLTIILGQCEIAVPLIDTDDPLRETINAIRTAAERAASLTGQLVAFSRRQIIQPRLLDLAEVVAEIRAMLTPLIGEDIDVRVSSEAGHWYVIGDVGQLQQVIINLALNARDAMPQGGTLTIETGALSYDRPHREGRATVPAGEYVVLSVIDTGIGMDEATRARIYEPFFTTKNPGQGTGLGLAMVYGIVKQSDGFIFAESRPGAGTVVRVMLPRAQGTPAAVVPVAPRPRAVSGNESVLIVEDEKEVRDLLCEYLVARGYAVLSAANGREAVELCRTRSEAPLVLVTDIVMPGMNGRVLAEQLRQFIPFLKVLFISGYTDDALVQRGSLPAGTHFLQKPFQLASLAQKIREMVDGAVA